MCLDQLYCCARTWFFSPQAWQRAGSVHKACTAAIQAGTSEGSIRVPSKSNGACPTTAQPEAMASATTKPKVSALLGNRKMLAVDNASAKPARVKKGNTVIFGGALCLNDTRPSPHPITTKGTSGKPRANASTISTPFRLSIFPENITPFLTGAAW